MGLWIVFSVPAGKLNVLCICIRCNEKLWCWENDDFWWRKIGKMYCFCLLPFDGIGTRSNVMQFLFSSFLVRSDAYCNILFIDLPLKLVCISFTDIIRLRSVFSEIARMIFHSSRNNNRFFVPGWSKKFKWKFSD